MNLSRIKKAYLIGIKGVMMTAIAQYLKEQGIKVSGSDTHEKFFTDGVLKAHKIPFKEKFDKKNVPVDADLVIYSLAYDNKNVEVKEAMDKGLKVMDHGRFLADIVGKRVSVGVAGTHGKSTTTAMLGFALAQSGFDPTVFAGTKVKAFKGNSRFGKSKFLVLEADEYKKNFLNYDLTGAVITSVDWDHPDIYPSARDYEKTFREFARKIEKDEFIVANGDSKAVRKITKGLKCRVLYYGFDKKNDFQAETIYENEFKVYSHNQALGIFKLKVFGDYNIMNALSVIATCQQLGVDLERVRKALSEFAGTARRFEVRGKCKGATIIDDYAHHPEEVKAALGAAKAIYPNKKIWCIFHPHTFTRTKALLKEFSKSFKEAHKVIVLDIYGSAREEQARLHRYAKHCGQGGIHSRDLVKAINQTKRNAKYIGGIPETAKFLKTKISDKDVVITMGAGDVWKVGDLLLKK